MAKRILKLICSRSKSRCKLLFLIAAFFIFFGSRTTTLHATQKAGRKIIGPTVGYLLQGWGYGGGAEYAITDRINAGFDFAYTKYTEETSYDSYTGPSTYLTYTTYATHSAFAYFGSLSYHFRPHQTIDPYIKGGLAYFKWQTTSISTGGNYTGIYVQPKELYAYLQLGMRIYIIENIAWRVAVGFPYYFSTGADFAF